MPYRSNDELPPSVRDHLPPHARDIFREAFNHAYAAHASDPRQEEAAHRIAWASSICHLRVVGTPNGAPFCAARTEAP